MTDFRKANFQLFIADQGLLPEIEKVSKLYQNSECALNCIGKTINSACDRGCSVCLDFFSAKQADAEFLWQKAVAPLDNVYSKLKALSGEQPKTEYEVSELRNAWCDFCLASTKIFNDFLDRVTGWFDSDQILHVCGNRPGDLTQNVGPRISASTDVKDFVNAELHEGFCDSDASEFSRQHGENRPVDNESMNLLEEDVLVDLTDCLLPEILSPISEKQPMILYPDLVGLSWNQIVVTAPEEAVLVDLCETSRHDVEKPAFGVFGGFVHPDLDGISLAPLECAKAETEISFFENDETTQFSDLSPEETDEACTEKLALLPKCCPMDFDMIALARSYVQRGDGLSGHDRAFQKHADVAVSAFEDRKSRDVSRYCETTTIAQKLWDVLICCWWKTPPWPASLNCRKQTMMNRKMAYIGL